MNIENLLLSKIPEDIALGVSLYYEKYGRSRTYSYFNNKINDIDHDDTRCDIYFDDLQVYCGFAGFSTALGRFPQITPSSSGCITFDFRTKKEEL